MDNLTVVLICIYFIINSFFCGKYYEENLFNYQISGTGKYLELIIGVLFLIPLIVLFYISMGFIFVVAKIDKYTQIRFWIKFIFTKKYDNLPKIELEKYNQFYKEKLESGKIKDKVFCFGIRMIFKRNKYKP